MPKDLTAAEQAAEDVMDLLVFAGPGHLRNGESIPIGGDLLGVVLTLLDPRCAITPEVLGHPIMRRIVDRLRPIIEAEALDEAAEALAQAATLAGREPYLTSQRLRFGLTSGAQRLRDRAEAARQSGEGPTDG